MKNENNNIKRQYLKKYDKRIANEESMADEKSISTSTAMADEASIAAANVIVIDYIEKSRRVQCGSVGVNMYLMLLEYDFSTGVSGYDGTPMPTLPLPFSNISGLIQAHVETKARENDADRS